MAVMVTVCDLAEQMHVNRNELYALARREDDPLPLKLLPGKRRGAAMLEADFAEWWGRNAVPFKEVCR